MTTTSRPGAAAPTLIVFPVLWVIVGCLMVARGFELQGVAMSERMIDRPGLNTPGEESAWNALRERVVISLRPIGAPTSLGFIGLAGASLTLTGLQLGWV